MSILAAFMVPHPPMIVPQVGKGSERQVRKTTEAYEQVAAEIAELQPDTIILTSPHTVMYSDYFHISPGKGARGSFADFRAGEVRFDEVYDSELVGRLEALAQERGISAGTLGERDRRLDHGTMVPLYFIRKHYTGGRLVRMLELLDFGAVPVNEPEKVRCLWQCHAVCLLPDCNAVSQRLWTMVTWNSLPSGRVMTSPLL